MPASETKVIAIRREASKPSADRAASPCEVCNFRASCIPAALPADQRERLGTLVYLRKRVMRGESLYRSHDAASGLYAIRSGSFKTALLDPHGREQVSGFFVGGELLGVDGYASGRHEDQAIALEDSEVCVLPYALLEPLEREIPALQRYLHAVLARELVRSHSVMIVLGSMKAQERLAAFLVDLSRRQARRGYSASELNLRMTRQEIGTYLGMTVETVSRMFSRLEQAGLLAVHDRQVRIVDAGRLAAVYGGASAGRRES